MLDGKFKLEGGIEDKAGVELDLTVANTLTLSSRDEIETKKTKPHPDYPLRFDDSTGDLLSDLSAFQSPNNLTAVTARGLSVPQVMAREVPGCLGVDAALYLKNEVVAKFVAGKATAEIGITTMTYPITEYCYS